MDNKRNKNILDYNKTNEDFNILLNYSNIDNTKHKICLKSKYMIKKDGVILIRVLNSSVGIGIWTKLNIENSKNDIFLFSKEKSFSKKMILGILALMLVVEFLFLIIIKLKKSNPN